MNDSIPADDDPLAPCLACGQSVPAGTLSCPACGYDVTRHNQWRLALGALGTALSLSVALAPIGLPLLWRAARHRRRAAGSATTEPAGSLASHLRAVLRLHLSDDSPARPAPDFTRGGASRHVGRPPEL